MTERARSWLTYFLDGSSDLAPVQPLSFKLIPRIYLAKAHLETANTTSIQEDEQWSHENQSCLDAPLGAAAQQQKNY